MPKNLFEDERPTTVKLSYIDGFRFGFGMFIGLLLGGLIVGSLAAIITRLF